MERKPLNYKKLSDMVPGDSGKIVLLEAGPEDRRVMENMGVTPGARISFRKYAPFGDPIEVRIRGCEIAIRKKDADSVIVLTDQTTEKRSRTENTGQRKNDHERRIQDTGLT